MNEANERMGSTPSLFIKGYLTDCFAKGERPTYGFPTNHLPETTGGDMEVLTGFLAPSHTAKN
jgi:hypothetical protein